MIEDKKAHFFEAHDKGYITPDYDLQKIDMGIALYNFETQILSEGIKPELSYEKPEISVPEGMDYVATISF